MRSVLLWPQWQQHQREAWCWSQVEALEHKVITKPVVAWVSGTCAKLFKSEVQFGHAGARSGGAQESAQVPRPPSPPAPAHV